MITAPQGAARHQLGEWSTPRLLRYFKARRKRRCVYSASFHPCFPGCDCGPIYTTDAEHTLAAMDSELDFIQSILKEREHVK